MRPFLVTAGLVARRRAAEGGGGGDTPFEVIITDNTTGGTHSGLQDIDMFAFAANSNRGTEVEIASGEIGATPANMAILGLPSLAGILPAGATVQEVEIQLNSQYGLNPGLTLNMHRILRAWSWATVTWNNYDGSNAWATAGAQGSGDYNTTPSYSAAYGSGGTGYRTLVGGSSLIADVQGMFDGTIAQRAWLLAFTGGSGAGDTWTSGRGADGSRPRVIIRGVS